MIIKCAIWGIIAGTFGGIILYMMDNDWKPKT